MVPRVTRSEVTRSEVTPSEVTPSEVTPSQMTRDEPGDPEGQMTRGPGYPGPGDAGPGDAAAALVLCRSGTDDLGLVNGPQPAAVRLPTGLSPRSPRGQEGVTTSTRHLR